MIKKSTFKSVKVYENTHINQIFSKMLGPTTGVTDLLTQSYISCIHRDI